MNFNKVVILLLLLAGSPAISLTQPRSSLPRSTPEKEGVASAAILQFVEAANHSKSSLHSFMLLRHGKVIAEAWWNPYRPELKHSLYSCSKSFTATAVGFAIAENLLRLEDKVVSFFPGYLSDTANIKMSQLTIKDMLMMADGQDPEPFSKIGMDSNWVRAFLTTRVIYDPGTKFLYNSLGSYMLSAIVQKVAGKTILEYLKPRLFLPLGIEGMDWETDTKGINTGGWGLRLKTEDMVKFAQLFLQQGKWKGKQILPPGWAAQASTVKIMQDPQAPASKKGSSDWLQGYCYQMWRCRHDAYRGDGAYGQFMIVMPAQDVALAITAEAADMQEELNLVWNYLLPAFKTGELPVDKQAALQLKKTLYSLALAPAAKTGMLPAENISGKNFTLAPNKEGIGKVGVVFEKKVCRLTIQKDNQDYTISFGDGQWLEGTTNKPLSSLTAGAIENTAFLYPAKITGSYRWEDGHSLQLILRYIESPHTETYTLHFNGSQLTMDMEKSFEFGTSKKIFSGTAN